MRISIIITASVLALLPQSVLAQTVLPQTALARTVLAQTVPADSVPVLAGSAERERSVFDGDYVIIGAGVGIGPSYEGSDNGQILPLAGATGEVGGIGFTIRGPSLSVDIITLDLGEDVTFTLGPQLRYRVNRPDNLGDDVVESLGKLPGVVEGGFRAGVSFGDLLSEQDNLSLGLSVRWDVSGKGSGRSITPAATYRLPLSRGLAVGFLASAQFIDDDYADYMYSIDAQGAANSGLPEFNAKGGLKELSFGFGGAADLNGNVLDGGFAIGAGVIYSRLFGSAADTPITSIRGSRDQWFLATGLGFIF